MRPTDRTSPVASPAPKPATDEPPADRPPASKRPAPRPQSQPRPAARRRVGVGIGRSALAVISVLALAATGYAWSTLRMAQDGLQTADVLDQGAAAKPPDGSMDILLVGMDSRTDAKGNPLPAAELNALHAGEDTGELDTDTMILIHIPTGGGKATGVSIPRDSWVNIPGYGMGKINSAYGLAKATALRKLKAGGLTNPAQLDVQSNQAGAKEAVETVEQLTGVGIDHYAAVNLDGFFQISNAIGGVPVCLLHPVDDTHWSGAVFPAGHFSVQGVKALEFVRQRHNIPGGSTDIEREQRQQAFMASMSHKILSQGVLTSPGTLNALIGAIQGAITIDNRWNLIDFAQEMSGMSSGAITFQTVPVVNIDYRPTPSVSAVEVDPAQIAAFVHGTTGAPTTPVSGQAAPPAGPTGNAAITVDVTNASGETGLAATVLDSLAAKGFTKGQTGNAAHRSKSVLFYPPGQEANAQAVQAAVSSQFVLEEGPSVPSGHVWVYLGLNYHGASDAAATIVAPQHPVVTDIAKVIRPATAPTTTATPPPGGTSPITDDGSAPCVN
jgi:LCP family protein required for cell wall assembly